MSSELWTSKLGQKYLRTEIEKNQNETKKQLDCLRRLPGNRSCADCGMEPTVWASVNLGVFLCIRCGSLHRGIGTHISVPKGCTGTYFWGPDEIDNMTSLGNEECEAIYGSKNFRPLPHASDAIWRKFIIDKYERRKFSGAANAPTDTQLKVTSNTRKISDSQKQKNLLPTYNFSRRKSVRKKFIAEDLLRFDSEVKISNGEHIISPSVKSDTKARQGIKICPSIKIGGNTKETLIESDSSDFFSDFGLY